MAWLKDYLKGLGEDFPPLEHVLTDERMNVRYRLVDLHAQNVSYDAADQSVVVDPQDGTGTNDVVLINPIFKQYMQKYGDSVKYITRNGTPWLSDEERENPTQVADYFRTLKTGEKQDLAIINWRKTDASSKDTGHAALSVGHLSFEGQDEPVRPEDIGPDGNLKPKTQEIEAYHATQNGSYYPFASLWIDRASRRDHLDAAKSRLVAKESPTAHAAGMVTRNTVGPAGIAAATAVAGGLIASKVAKSKSSTGRKIAGVAMKTLAVAGAAYGVGRAASILQNAPGAVLMKEEARGHGVMATLITPMQRDIFEHTMHGLNKTYYKDYQILSHNCADFTEHMMQEIGLNTHHMVDRAMKSEPQLKDFARRAAKNLTIPSHIRPDRHQWATRKAVGEGRHIETGEIEVDGQTLLVRKLQITGQSTILIETENQDFFKGTPLETLDKALQEGLVVEPSSKKRQSSEFGFSPDTRILPPSEKISDLSR